MAHITGITYFVPVESDDYQDTIECVDSYRRYIDRFIVVQNGAGKVNVELLEMADVYLINKVNKLMGGAVNEGFKIASAFSDTEYLLFIDNGTKVVDGLDIGALCTDGIASPHIGGQEAPMKAHACVFMVHRETFEGIGLWNNTYGNESDQDWFERAEKWNVNMYQTDDVVSHEHVSKGKGKVDYFNIKTEIV